MPATEDLQLHNAHCTLEITFFKVCMVHSAWFMVHGAHFIPGSHCSTKPISQCSVTHCLLKRTFIDPLLTSNIRSLFRAGPGRLSPRCFLNLILVLQVTPHRKQMFLISSHSWAIPCQKSEKKGQRRKVDFFKGNVKDNKANC